MKAPSDSKSRALSNGMLAASPVLENMFDEAFWKSENMIRIFGVSSNAVEVSVSFMYSNSFSCQLFTGELDPNVTAKHIHQVFRQYGNLAHARIPGGKQCGFVQLAERYVTHAELDPRRTIYYFVLINIIFVYTPAL
ncbi:polyadenylate-binding protein RBP45B [Tanacetum coccineum]